VSTDWDPDYATKSEAERSWSQGQPLESLAAIDRLGLPHAAPLLDVGGGASRLVDALLERGFDDVTVLDISQRALDEARSRIAAASRAEHAHWIVTDVCGWAPSRRFGLWHDRAAFHFLTTPDEQAAYLIALRAGTAPGSYVIMATFAPDGPGFCSGRPVQRWSAEALAAFLGGDFTPLSAEQHSHTTPWGVLQSFTWATFVRNQ